MTHRVAPQLRGGGQSGSRWELLRDNGVRCLGAVAARGDQAVAFATEDPQCIQDSRASSLSLGRQDPRNSIPPPGPRYRQPPGTLHPVRNPRRTLLLDGRTEPRPAPGRGSATFHRRIAPSGAPTASMRRTGGLSGREAPRRGRVRGRCLPRSGSFVTGRSQIVVTKPPSILRSDPVMFADRSLARNTTRSATSSGVVNRPMAAAPAVADRTCSGV